MTKRGKQIMKDRRMVPLADLEEAQAKIERLQKKCDYKDGVIDQRNAWNRVAEKEIERLRHEIDVQCSSEYVERILKENERLQAALEHLQDQCKEKHDSMIAMMNEALGLRAALERISKRARQKWNEGKEDDWLWVYKTADEAIHEKDKD